MENARFSSNVFAVGDSKNATLLLSEVLDGNLKAVEIRDFLTDTECDEVVSLLEKMDMDADYLHGQARKIGVSAHNKQNDQPGYFAEVANHPLLNQPLVQRSVSLLLDVLRSTGDHRLVEIATNEKGNSYSPTIIREFFATLKLHNDLASREQKGWHLVEQVERQFAYVIKLSQCVGGETYFYPKQWEPTDEQFFNHEDNYSYDMAAVAEVPEFKIDGPKGTLIFFDSTNYHRVAGVIEGRRYTMGGFVGVLPEGKLIVWS